MEQWSKLSRKAKAAYMDAFGQLAGKAKAFSQGRDNSTAVIQSSIVVTPKPKKPRQHLERDAQIKFVTWLAKMGYRFNASAAGGSRNLYEALNFKRMGVSKGFPDVEVPYPVAPYHGFYIELKSHSGKVSPEQLEWLNYLKEQGYYAEVAYSFEEAKQHFEYYLSLMPSAA